MSSLVKTLLGAQHPSFGQPIQSTAAMDLFVLATLGFLFFLLGCFATWAWLIWRRANRPEPHVKLLMELDGHEPRADPETEDPKEKTKQQPPEEDETAPWERPGDWWKQ
jgi:hypothetical protein